MSGASHTLGEWLRADRTIYALDESGRCNRFSCHVHGGFSVRRVPEHGDRTSEAELEANARLIAAAPELLEALEECVSELNDLVGEYREHSGNAALGRANAAIAKARGEAA